MLRAAVNGQLDFSETDLRDTWWVIKAGLILQEVQDQEILQFLKISHDRSLAYISSSMLQADTINHHLKLESELYDDYIHLLMGVEKDKDGKGRQEQIKDAMKKAWTQEFGDPDDPETQAKIDAAVLQLQLSREQGSKRGPSNPV